MATMLTAPAQANPGGTATLTWSGIAVPLPGDWIGLYAPGDPDAGPIREWVYATPTVPGAIGSRARPGAGSAAGTCIFPVPADTAATPIPPGTYEFRLFSNDSFARLAVSGAVTLQAATISGTPSAVIPGQSLSVAFGGLDSPTPGDWFTMFVPGADDHTYSLPWFYVGTGTKTKPGAGAASGSVPYVIPTGPPGAADAAPAAGTYELRMFARDGFSKLATSPPISISIPPATISVSGSSFVRGTSIPVSWAIPIDPTPTDWIGMYPVGASDDATLISPFNSTWVYANNGRQAVIPTTAKTSGLVNCAIATGTPANKSYEFRLFKQNTYTLLARSTPFTVLAAPPLQLFSPTSPWNVKATGYSVDPNNAAYIQNLAYVMDAVKNAGQGPQNILLNGPPPPYMSYGVPPYTMPVYTVASGVVPVRVTARREYGHANPWWGPEQLTNPAGWGFSGVPIPAGARPDHGYGGCDSGSYPPCSASYPRYDPDVSPAMAIFPLGGWNQWQTGDHSLIIVSPSLNAVWEFWKLGLNVPDPNTGVVIQGWSASGAVKWALNGPGWGPVASGMGSARAYGGSGVAGLIFKSEMDAGVIPHALAFAYSYTDGIYYANGQNTALNGPPCIATHADGYCPTKGGVSAYIRNNAGPGRIGGTANGWSIPEGARLRLKQTANLVADRAATWEAAHPGRGAAARIIGTALQQYGMYVVDHSGILYDARNPTTQLPTATLYAEHEFGLPNQSWGSALTSNDARAFGSADFEVLALPALTRLDPATYPCTA